MLIRELRHLKQTRSLGNGHMMVYTVASGYDCQFLGAMQSEKPSVPLLGLIVMSH
jgi:hypothetical protein